MDLFWAIQTFHMKQPTNQQTSEMRLWNEIPVLKKYHISNETPTPLFTATKI